MGYSFLNTDGLENLVELSLVVINREIHPTDCTIFTCPRLLDTICNVICSASSEEITHVRQFRWENILDTSRYFEICSKFHNSLIYGQMVVVAVLPHTWATTDKLLTKRY